MRKYPKQYCMLAILASDAPWQYYNKFKKHLEKTRHPFLQQMVFYRDTALTLQPKDLHGYGAVAFYYHDPLKALYPEVYAYAKTLEDYCNEKGIPWINKTEALSNSIKSVQLSLLRQAGFHVARAFPFSNISALAEVPADAYPLFLRIDAGHDSQGEFIQGPFTDYKQLQANYQPFAFADKQHHRDHVAIQFIDTVKTQGCYAKYRCLVTRHQVLKAYSYFSNAWYIHGHNTLRNDWTHAADQQYIESPITAAEKALFLEANRVLDLDFCAYDYAYTPNGELVIWEANPHPAFQTLSDTEPMRSRILHLLTSYYATLLPPIPWHVQCKHQLLRFLR